VAYSRPSRINLLHDVSPTPGTMISRLDFDADIPMLAGDGASRPREARCYTIGDARNCELIRFTLSIDEEAWNAGCCKAVWNIL
jgi:hypothetical protein